MKIRIQNFFDRKNVILCERRRHRAPQRDAKTFFNKIKSKGRKVDRPDVYFGGAEKAGSFVQ